MDDIDDFWCMNDVKERRKRKEEKNDEMEEDEKKNGGQKEGKKIEWRKFSIFPLHNRKEKKRFF